jgi:lysozyme family protein
VTVSIPADFEKALAFAMKWEVGGDMRDGGYTDDPRDPGGKTKWGISHRSYPHLDIAALTYQDARDIYIADYWLTSGRQRSCCDRMPWPLNAVHFDCAVNVGNWKITKAGEPLFHGRANMILQRALGVDDDGVIGPLTLAALREQDPVEVAKRAVQQRDMYYATRARWADPFRQGWYNRTNDLRRTVFPLH